MAARTTLCFMLLMGSLGACAKADDRIEPLRPLTGATPAEQHILAEMKRVSDLNASVGDEPVVFHTKASETLSLYRKYLETRVKNDLVNQYGSDIPRPDQAFILFGERSRDWIIHLVRVRDTNASGDYVPLEGLVYIVSKRNGHILDVQPSMR